MFPKSETEVGKQLSQLPHFEMLACPECENENRVHVLQMYHSCPKCGTHFKNSSLGPTAKEELLSTVDEVLAWVDTEEALAAILKRRTQLMEAIEKEQRLLALAKGKP